MLNFEELENEPLRDAKKLHSFLKGKLAKGTTTYIFLDEIQKVERYEEVLDSLYVKKGADLYVTGSTILEKDVLKRNKEGGRMLVGQILKYMADNISSLTSPKRICAMKEILKSIQGYELFATSCAYLPPRRWN